MHGRTGVETSWSRDRAREPVARPLKPPCSILIPGGRDPDLQVRYSRYNMDKTLNSFKIIAKEKETCFVTLL